jgi:hypothetical protein
LRAAVHAPVLILDMLRTAPRKIVQKHSGALRNKMTGIGNKQTGAGRSNHQVGSEV